MPKRGVALLLSVLMVWVLALPAGAAVNPFSDLKSDHWAYEAVIKLAAAGLIEGYPDGTFGGDRNFTRYEMAMVFARILARFERLIDEKIDAGIAERTEDLEARTADLAARIETVKDELAQKIEANQAELLEQINALAADLDNLEGDVDGLASDVDGLESDVKGLQRDVMGLETDVAVLEGQVKNIFPLIPAAGQLSEAAQGALSEAAAEEIEARLEGLASSEDLEDLARRILRLEDATLTRDDAESIAEKVVAAALADTEAEFEAALKAVEGEVGALEDLLAEKVRGLDARITALAQEFRPELERLGVEVARLEERIRKVETNAQKNEVRITKNEVALMEQQSEIEEIKESLDNVRFTGKNETVFEHTVVAGDASAKAYQDPRNFDSDTFKNADTFKNELTLTLAASPAENVDITATLNVVSDVFGDGTDGEFGTASANIDLTTPGILRSLHVGDLDKDGLATQLDKYTLVADEFGDQQGANLKLVYGFEDSTTLNGFVSRSGDGQHALGGAASYTLSDEFDLTFRGVRYAATPALGGPSGDVSESNVSVESKGSLDMIDYWAKVASNGDDTPATAVEAWLEAPVLFTTARLDYGTVGANWDSKYGKDLDRGADDWLERYLYPDDSKDFVAEGQSEYKVTVSAPLLGAETAVAFGQRDETGSGGDADTFTQASISDVEFAGVDLGLLYDQRVNGANETDRTLRVDAGTMLLGFDVDATIHNRSNEQAAVGEQKQQATWVKANRDINLILPLSVDVRYGMNQVSGDTHTRVGVRSEYQLGAVTVNAGYTTEQNAIGDVGKDADKLWWKNSEWSSDQRDTMTAGASYTLKGFFGTDIDTGYEYKLVSVNGSPYDSAQSTVTASFEKDLRGGEATLAGDFKLVTGGLPYAERDGNDSDMTANVSLTYPVFDGGEVTLGGKYVSSSGDRAADADYDGEYNVFQLKAGLTVSF